MGIYLAIIIKKMYYIFEVIILELNLDYNGNKGFRMLNIYERLNKGEVLGKEHLAQEFNVSGKTIQRDMDDIRAYLAETHYTEADTIIKYSRSKQGYYLVRNEREWFDNKEVTAIIKILLESRAFQKAELTGIIDKLIMQTAESDRRTVKEIINNEYANYIPLRHNKMLLPVIWELTEYITSKKVIEFYYSRQDKKTTKKCVKPVAIMFSEFYFYLIAYMADGSKDYPIVFRIDRIFELKPTGEHFQIPYSEKFNDGEFRKRVQFMYSGELKKVKFRYNGVLEALLDRLPTTEIIEKDKNGVIATAEAFGDGIYMWLRSQGDLAQIIE